MRIIVKALEIQHKVVAGLLFSAVCCIWSATSPLLAGNEATVGKKSSDKFLRLPSNQSIGSICTYSAMAPGGTIPAEAKWLSQAQGTVRIPKNRQVLLKVFPQAVDNLAGLTKLTSDDLQAIDLSGSDLADAGMKNLQNLAGLVSVNVNFTDVSDRGLQFVPTGVRNLELMETRVQGMGLKRFARLWRITLDGSDIADSGMKYLAPFKTLRNLSLNRTRVTDAGLLCMGSLPELTELSLQKTRITGAGLKAVADAPKLNRLTLGGVSIDDEALKPLPSALALKHLSLQQTRVTDRGMATLSKLSNLEELRIDGNRITDNGLKQLGGMISLRSLNLSGTQITDPGLAFLHSLTSLQSLNLAETSVTDKGLTLLGKMNGLREVVLVGTKVTSSGVARLKAAIPACVITHD